MKKITFSSVVKNILFWGIIVLGIILGMMILGEETPDCPYTFGDLVVVKFGALGCLYALYHFTRFLYRRGWLPGYIISEINDCLKEEEK